MSSASILGLGTALPRHSVPQRQAARMALQRSVPTARQAQLLPALYRMTQVQRRASVLLQPESRTGAQADSAAWLFPPASPAGQGGAVEGRGPTTRQRLAHYRRLGAGLALAAARAALADSGLATDRITHLVTTSCTGFTAPGIDIDLIRGLPLSPNVQRCQIGFMGCSAAMNGLQAASAFSQAGTGSNVLLCCVELCSLHFQYGWDPQQIVANALFADGAAAAVVGQRPAASSWSLRSTATQFLEGTEDQMGWEIGDHGFEMRLSPQLPETLRGRVRPWLESWLAEHDLELESIGSWAIHPGGPRLLKGVGETLGLEPARLGPSHRILRDCGNMSSPTILFILERLRAEGAPLPCVALAFGPGLVAEGTLFV